MSTSKIAVRRALHKNLDDFSLFAELQIPILVKNILTLNEEIPKGLTNPILIFLLNHACTHVVEMLVLQVSEAWKIHQKVFRDLNLNPLSSKDPDYKKLDMIRDKLIAHRVKVSVHTDKYIKKYKSEIGSYENVFSLIQKVSDKILAKIEELRDAKLLESTHASGKVNEKIKKDDISRLLNALKEKNIF